MDEVFTVADASSSRSTPSLLSSSSIGTNLPLLYAFLAFAIAQVLKLLPPVNTCILECRFKEKRWDSRRLYGSGGMPSSHSATGTALAVAIGLQEGTGGSSFALAVVLAAIVMYDASGVRLHAGQQAVYVSYLLNTLYLMSGPYVNFLVTLHFRLWQVLSWAV
ncbi:hypothetical protein AAC387_Pa08g1424 [Persea americana]